MVELTRRDVAGVVTEATDTLSDADTIDEVLERYLRIAAAALPARSFGIYLFPSVRSQPVISATEGVSDLFLARYEDVGRDRDPVYDHALTSGQATHSAHLMSSNCWQQLDIYKDVLALHRMRMVLEAPVMSGSQVVGTLNFGDRDPGRLAAPSDIATASVLGRVVGTTVSALNRRRELERERDQAFAALDLATEALVITDLETGRRRLNESARQLLDTLAPGDPNVWLEDTMAAIAHRGATNDQDAYVPVTESGMGLSMRTVPGPPGSRVSISALRADKALSSEATLPHSIAALLSPREQEVARLAVLGLHDEQIAARVFLSRYTVKWAVSTILDSAFVFCWSGRGGGGVVVT